MTRWRILTLVSLLWLPLHGCGDTTCPPSPPPGTPPPAPTTHRVPADYATIQEAMDAAMEGDTVLVAPGTYEGPGNVNLNPNGVSMVIRSVAGPESTIIRLRSASSAVTAGFKVWSGENGPMAIEGFTFRDGTASFDWPLAISCLNSRLLVRDCHVVESGGGAFKFINSIVTLVRCRVERTFSRDSAVNIRGGTARFDHCVMSGNRSLESGGAAWIKGARVVFSGCELTRNMCWGNYGGVGGALRIEDAVVDIEHCLIARNHASEWGGAIDAHEAVLSIDYCTISENFATFGGAIGIPGDDTSVIMTNSILAANVPSDVFGFGGLLHISNSAVDTTHIPGDVDFHYDATIITADPQLCRLEGAFSNLESDYHPRPGSPCLTPYRIGALPSGCNE